MAPVKAIFVYGKVLFLGNSLVTLQSYKAGLKQNNFVDTGSLDHYSSLRTHSAPICSQSGNTEPNIFHYQGVYCSSL